MASSALSLARLGSPDGKQPIDLDMAGLYLKLADPVDENVARKFREAGAAPAVQNGHISFNGAVSALHRREQWLAAMTGMVKFRRGLEIYGWTQANNYGMYARNGCMFILSKGDPVNLKASGFNLEGWDWRRWPATTAVLRPPQSMFVGYGMLGNGSPIGGGTSLDGNGVWGMYLQGKDIGFKKSAFFFNDRITVITSDIHTNTKYPVVTTMCQMSLDGRDDTTVVNGKVVSSIPDTRYLSCRNRSNWFMDNKSNGYYIFPGQSAMVNVGRRHQQWTYMVKKYLKDPKDNPIIDIRKKKYREHPFEANEKYFNPSKGDFFTAGFEHGLSPDARPCSYMVKVDTTPENMKLLSENMKDSKSAPCRILQQDSTAHSVYDRECDTYGYVLFESNALLSAQSPLVSNSHPSFVMIQRKGRKAIDLSLATSDITLKEPITLKLKGEWKVSGDNPDWLTLDNTEKGDTKMTVKMDYYIPRIIKLTRRGLLAEWLHN
jgi:chondroitin-sulfate-ABC endolyase/exolyase